jgi:hypothetical protein
VNFCSHIQRYRRHSDKEEDIAMDCSTTCVDSSCSVPEVKAMNAAAVPKVESQDEAEVDVVCTICQHELNNPVYKVCKHPLLPVATCLECYNEFCKSWNLREPSDEDMCAWCGEFKDLFVCGDEKSSCPYGFCEECITENLGTSARDSVRSTGVWHCLVCEPFPSLSRHHSTLIFGKAHSIYKQSILEEEDSEKPRDDVTELQIENEIGILATCINESNTAAENLDSAGTAAIMSEIHAELRLRGGDERYVTARNYTSTERVL